MRRAWLLALLLVLLNVPAPAEPLPFTARTRHLLPLLLANPALEKELFWRLGGIDMYPVSPITSESFRVMRKEAAAFDRKTRDGALHCSIPVGLPPDYQVLVLDLDAVETVPIPLFLAAEAMELGYVEVSLHRPGRPVMLVVTSHNARALRLAVSTDTELAGVHLLSYYPGVVLGVPPQKVTRSYFPQAKSARGNCQYLDPQSSKALQQLGLRPAASEVIRLKGKPPFSVGEEVAMTLESPLLGSFLDLDMPVPSQYGLAVLASRGYLRVRAVPDSSREELELRRTFRMPAGLAGSHSRTFVLPQGVKGPSGDLGHSTLKRANELSSSNSVRK